MRAPAHWNTADFCIYRLVVAHINLYISLLLLYSCTLVANVGVSVPLLNDSPHPFILHAFTFFVCVWIIIMMVVLLGSEEIKVKSLTF